MTSRPQTRLPQASNSCTQLASQEVKTNNPFQAKAFPVPLAFFVGIRGSNVELPLLLKWMDVDDLVVPRSDQLRLVSGQPSTALTFC